MRRREAKWCSQVCSGIETAATPLTPAPQPPPGEAEEWSDEAGDISEGSASQWEVTECVTGGFVGASSAPVIALMVY